MSAKLTVDLERCRYCDGSGRVSWVGCYGGKFRTRSEKCLNCQRGWVPAGSQKRDNEKEMR